MKILFIADQFTDSTRTQADKYPGGAELTDLAAIAAAPWPVATARCAEVDPNILKNYDLHILGNSQFAPPVLLQELSRLGRHILFEHDVRICRWRGNFPILVEPGHRLLQRCNCPHTHLRKLYDTAIGTLFLTHRQLAVFEKNPWFRTPHSAVIGSSLFDPTLFDLPVSTTREGTLYFESRAKMKGAKQAREYAEQQGWNPVPIKNLTPPEVLQKFSSAQRFVYLPIGLEPAGRMVAEARVLGCQVITNSHVGVAQESWWHLPTPQAIEVLKDAPHRFWRLVQHMMDAPKGVTSFSLAKQYRKDLTYTSEP